MQSPTANEIEYLNSLNYHPVDYGIVAESIRLLEALRKYDQDYCSADWQPHPVDRASRRKAK